MTAHYPAEQSASEATLRYGLAFLACFHLSRSSSASRQLLKAVRVGRRGPAEET